MEPHPKKETARAETTEELSAAEASIDALVARGDANALIELGASYRAGTAPGGKDAFAALECFEAASRLGSSEAEYLVGLAFFNGRGIEVDRAEGAKRLRSAAQRGSVRAKVYVANLYELGVHYEADKDKADVWYRNVARAAEIDAAPGTDEYEIALAELGCVRQCLTLVADDALPKKDRAFYLKKAKSMGYRHRLETARAARTPNPEAQAETQAETQAEIQTATSAEASIETEATAQPEGARGEEPRPESTPEDEDEPGASVPLGSRWTFGHGLAAFVVALFFAAAATATGWLAMEGSRALAELGRPIPLLGPSMSAEASLGLFATIVFALGVLPAMSTYRPRVVAIGTFVGGIAAAAGWFLFASLPLLWDATAQAAAFGLGGYLVLVLVLGVLGGTRVRPRIK